MKAALLREQGESWRLSVEQVDDPRPGDTQVVVKVLACGVCGHDQADRQGLLKLDLPCVMGHEIAGEIVAVGAKVRGFSVGDVVACKQFTTCGVCAACRSGQELDCAKRYFNYGGNAEYVALEDNVLLRVPDGVDPVAASVVACTVGTCYQALVRVGGLRGGEWVVVAGAGGGLGLHGVQVAAAQGARVVAVTGSPHKAEVLRQHGAERVVVTQGSARYADEILDATGGRGADVVLDTVGHPDGFSQCYRALRKRGRYVFTGQIYRERIALYPLHVFSKQAVITGSSSTLMSSFISAMDLVARGAVRPVTTVYPLDEATAANQALDARQVAGRAVLVP